MHEFGKFSENDENFIIIYEDPTEISKNKIFFEEKTNKKFFFNELPSGIMLKMSKNFNEEKNFFSKKKFFFDIFSYVFKRVYFPKVATITALMVCILFSASSKAMDASDSKTSSVTSSASRPYF